MILRRKKRGMVDHLGIMMLILAGAIVIFFFTNKFVSKVDAEAIINTCRFSVMAQTATEISPGITGFRSPLDVNCETRFLKFYNTKVDMGISPEDVKPMKIDLEGKKVTKFKELNDFIVNQVVAEELRICKFQFGDGKVDIFPNNDNNIFFNKKVCYICSEIVFTDTVKKDKFYGLVDYTKNTKNKNDGRTYFESLTEETTYTNKMWSQPFYESNIDISRLDFDKTKSYVVFVEKYTGSTTEFLYKNAIWVTVAEKSLLNKYCDETAS